MKTMEKKKENDVQPWKTLHSEYLIRKPWLTARRDEVQLPDGRVSPEYYVLEYPDWVNVIAITKDGRYVMERQYRHAAGRTCYELPCGVMEAGEQPLEAVRRELKEETGFTGGEWQEVMQLSANPSTMTNTIHCFVATGVEKTCEPQLDATEDLSVHLLSRDEVLAIVREGKMIQSPMLASLLKHFSGL